MGQEGMAEYLLFRSFLLGPNHRGLRERGVEDPAHPDFLTLRKGPVLRFRGGGQDLLVRRCAQFCLAQAHALELLINGLQVNVKHAHLRS